MRHTAKNLYFQNMILLHTIFWHFYADQLFLNKICLEMKGKEREKFLFKTHIFGPFISLKNLKIL